MPFPLSLQGSIVNVARQYDIIDKLITANVTEINAL